MSSPLDEFRRKQREAKAKQAEAKREREIEAQEKVNRRLAEEGLLTEGQRAAIMEPNSLPPAFAERMWQPGQSGNPAGRPPIPSEVLETLKAASPKAARRLAELVDNPDPSIALKAIDMLQNRIYGRPAQTLDAKIETTNVQQAHLQVLLQLQEKRDQVMKTIEGTAEDKSEEGA